MFLWEKHFLGLSRGLPKKLDARQNKRRVKKRNLYKKTTILKVETMSSNYLQRQLVHNAEAVYW